MSPASPAPHASDASAALGSAAIWAFAMDGGRIAITTGTTFALAALLGPETLGLASLALGYVLLIEMIQRQGLVAALVQRRDLRPEHLDVAFWLIVSVSGVLTVATLIFAGPWASLYRTPELRDVILGLSPLVPIMGAAMVPEALFRRALDFRSLAMRSNAAAAVAAIFAVVLALAGAGIWALVAQHLISAALRTGSFWLASDWRPTRRWDRVAARDLLGFSFKTFVASIAVFVALRGDTMLVGFYFGAEAAGLYFLGSRIVNLIIDLFARPVQGVALPELSRHQDRLDLFEDRLQSMLRLVAVLSFPALALAVGAADDLMSVIGRAEWAGAARVVEILAIAAAARVVQTLAGPVLQALGKPGSLAWLTWVSSAIMLGLVAAAGLALGDRDLDAQLGGLAGAKAAAGIVVLIITTSMWRRLTAISVTGLGRTLRSPLAVSMLVIGTTMLVGRLDLEPAVLTLAIKVAAAGSIWLGWVAAFHRDDARQLVNRR